MALLDDLKKLRRTRWPRLVWPTDCPALAARFPNVGSSEACRVELIRALSSVEADLASEPSLIRYSRCASAVLLVLLGLAEATADASADARYEAASRIAGVPVTTLKTRDGNLLLDALARALASEWEPARLGMSGAVPAGTEVSRTRSLESLVRRALWELAPTYAASAWRHCCQPIIELERDHRRLRREVSYTAGIEYRKIGPMYCYQVTSSFRSLRALPRAEIVDVAFCRTTAALEREYRVSETIAVELCEFDRASWEQVAAHLATDLHIGPGACTVAEIHRDADVTRLRFEMPRTPSQSLHVPVVIRNTYVIPASTRVYPIRLGDYFTSGPCEMSVTLIDPRAESLDAFAYFSPLAVQPPDPTAASGESHEIERFLTPEGARQQTVRVRSPRGTLLWPFSGADFVWRRR
jgi:hypothetical protein